MFSKIPLADETVYSIYHGNRSVWSSVTDLYRYVIFVELLRFSTYFRYLYAGGTFRRT
jgi:hypothetical protein